MAKKNYTPHQHDIISRYYKNIDSISLSRIQELVTELYLAETESKRDKLWERVHKAMLKLNLKPAIIDHIMHKKDVTILAKNLQDWLKAPPR